ncbi:heparinase II/III domain-containing protein [Lacrimispora sp.]|uniref:heparinase II/III domain-containing protein n=1 Tax=Lacrimispora sp. TaxID=2719234 RepID=UPI0028ADC059|nr:heparinase II/III family protein [Lacrimispora sp.]
MQKSIIEAGDGFSYNEIITYTGGFLSMIPIPVKEGEVTDEDLFSALQLSYPGLSNVRLALEAGNTLLAKKELVSYFQTRTNVIYYYNYRSLPLKPIDTDSNPQFFQAALGLKGSLKEFCLYAGKRMMEHVYVRPGGDIEVELGPDYENLPHFNVKEDLGKKHRTVLDIFSRGQFFEYLAILYHETGDPAVLENFEVTLQMFWDHYPLDLEFTDPDISHFLHTEDRDVMSTGFLTLCYLSLFYTRIPYEISTEMAFGILKRIWFLGIQFRRFDTDTYRKFNHHMWERGLVPFMLATLLPEFPALAAMKDRGTEVVRQHVIDDFNEAGGYSEHSVAYWCGAALGEMISNGIYLGQLNRTELLDEESGRRIQASYNILAEITPPDDSFPSLGDNGGPKVKQILSNGAYRTGNDACRQLLEYRLGQTEDIPKIPLDYCNDKSGFFCSRSNLSADANYALMSSKVDCGDSGHNHMDMLSLFITMRGQELIGEPHSRHLYHSVRAGSPQRGYMYNMTSHNTVLVYGNPVQDDRFYTLKWGVMRPDSPVEHFSSRKEGCFVSAYHDAYTFCRHTRKILACREKGFLIHDCIRGGDRIPEPHIQRWNLFPDVSYRQLDDRRVLLEKNGILTLLLWSGTPSLHIWQKEDLYPEIVKDRNQLSTIIDAHFTPVIDAESGIGPVSQSLLILDATDGIPTIRDCDSLCDTLLSHAEHDNLTAALDLFLRIK